jgi:acetyltransferase-like isoleucine patch superfamily enzyme/dTDP-4-dehydrorhamnose 3,5-epimerase-like enzyme
MNGAKAFIHLNALCESTHIGSGTRIWAFSHILEGAVIGADCNICESVFIENDVVIGDRTTVKNGVQLWDGIRLGSDVFVGPNCTFTNDRMPRSRQRPEKFLETVVENGASIGANATILPGVRIGSGAMVGAGAVVTRNVPPNTIVVGNPAQIRGYVSEGGATLSPISVHESSVESAGDEPRSVARIVDVGVSPVRLVRLPQFEDLRGSLAVIEIARDLQLPAMERIFFVHSVPNQHVRGEHAHRKCHQVLLCTHGSVSVLVDNGSQRATVRLDDPNHALHVPPRVWASQFSFSPDAVLTVLASHAYDESDYIRSYEAFSRFISDS